MRKILITLYTFLALLPLTAAGQPCLKLVETVYNPNAAYIDSCSSSPTYDVEYYSRDAYSIVFDWDIIHSPIYLTDTLLVFHWMDIDSGYPTIRSAFAAVEAKFGNFTLTKRYPYALDTSAELNKSYVIHFDTYSTLIRQWPACELSLPSRNWFGGEAHNFRPSFLRILLWCLEPNRRPLE